MALFGARRASVSTTLVVETTDLRFLTVRSGRVEKWGSFPLPGGLVSQGLVNDALEMGKIIEELFAAEGLEREQVIISVSGLRSIPRVVSMPQLPASQLGQAVSRVARREMPVPIETLYLSWEALSETGNQQRVYLLGVPRELIDGQVRALQAADISVRVMDLKPLALIRAVAQAEAIVANLEQDELGVAIVVDHLPALVRTFSLESENLSDPGRIDRLAAELQQTVRFHNDSRQGLPVGPRTPVYVTGKLFDSADAYDYLASVVDRPVERPSSPIPCPDALPLGEYATNLGLALKRV